MATDGKDFVIRGYGGPDFIQTGGRLPVHLLRSELETLATVNYHGFLNGYHSIPSDIDRELLLSLMRLGLVDDGELRDGGRTTPGRMVSEAGRQILAMFRPERFGCRCEHAVQLPCWCSESTFCPDPAHTGNGCHGTHD